MASKNVKRALMGFAAGALGATQRYFETQRAQEAERLKEERLAAIRASERAEDRAFQIAQTDRTLAAQESRDERTIEAQAARDQREAERRMAELEAQGKQRERELGIQGANQLAYAGAARGPDRGPDRVLVRSPDNKLLSLPIDDPRLQQGLEGYQMVEGRAGTRFAEIPNTDTPRPAATAGPTPAGQRSGMQEFREGDRRMIELGKYEIYRGGQWVPET